MGIGVPSAGRRSIIKRGLIGVGAALAVLVGKREAQAAVPPVGGAQFTLYGRGLYAYAADLRFGALPSTGDRYAVYGDLTVAREGVAVGAFTAACFALGAPSATATSSLEVQTLTLSEGSIVGIGSGAGERRSFAIVGGTGRYAGARGSYLATQDVLGLGGSGIAEFTITLL